LLWVIYDCDWIGYKLILGTDLVGLWGDVLCTILNKEGIEIVYLCIRIYYNKIKYNRTIRKAMKIN
jgi:hypothetical protein